MTFWAKLVFKAFNRRLDFLKLSMKFFALIQEMHLNLFSVIAQTRNSIIDFIWYALYLSECMLDILVDFFADLKLWVLIHQLDPLDERSVLCNNFTSSLISELLEINFKTDKLIRLFSGL